MKKILFIMFAVCFLLSENALSQEKFFTNNLGMKFVIIKSGVFMMGSPKTEKERGNEHGIDEFLHKVTISKDYYMQTTEVTQGQWKKVMGNNPSRFIQCGDDCPVEQVSWNDVQQFIKKLNQMEKIGKYRLPTEAEWEYACRTGSTGSFCFGEDVVKNYNRSSDPGILGQYAWFIKTTKVDSTNPVGKLKPNAFGLYDMHGNVFEWCQDLWTLYPGDPLLLKEENKGYVPESPVFRGGCYDSSFSACRCAFRQFTGKDERDYYIGFRLVKDK